MKKIISFCLWGDDPKYTKGAIENADIATELYPSWTCRYYVGKVRTSQKVDSGIN